MRRSGINIAVIAAVLLSSCSREDVLTEQNGSPLPEEQTPLTISTGEMTRTSLSGTVVNWSDDDRIAVFDDLHYNNMFDAVEVSGSAAVFEGLVTARTTDFYAVYPYSDAVNADAQSIFVSLPADQTPVSGTFAEEHNISVAHGTKTAEADVVEGVVFKNVCALIQFTVPQRLAEVAEVSFTADNRNIAGDLKAAKSDFGVTCTSGVRTVRMTGDFSAGSTFYFVVAPGEINGFSAKVTTKNGATYTNSSTKTFTAKAGTIKNLGEIDFAENPSAVARHSYDADGVLTGTSVEFSLGLPDGMEKYVTRVSARMKDSSGIEYRYLSKSSASASNHMEVYAQREYVPAGQYTIQYEYVINGVVKGGYTTMTVDEKPQFTVSVSAYTSYSRYSKYCDTNGADVSLLNEANACDGSTIYDIRYSVSISDAVIRQCGLMSCSGQISNKNGVYSQVSSHSGTASTSSSEFYSMSKFPNLPWGEYSLRAEATFDGVTKSEVRTLHVTGLPYKADPPTNSGLHPWSGSAYSWSGDYVRLHKHTISQTFHAPVNIGVTVYQNARIYTRSDDCTYEVTLSGKKLYSISQSSIVPATKTTNVSESYSATITGGNPVLSLSNSYGTMDAGLEYTNVKVYEIRVNYR